MALRIETGDMTIELGPSGILAKVTAIGGDGNSVYFDLRNGKTGSLDNVDQEYCIGDVLLITGDVEHNQVEIEKVPRSAWPDDLWVGIVKIKLPDITVIDSGARFRTVPTVSVPCYEIGNTVLAGDVQGVTRVLSERAIKYIDLPEVDDSVIDRFRLTDQEGDLDFDDFGGLSAVVNRARELVEAPLRSGQALTAIGARPIKGVLFTGEPGTGKTMLARIIAAQAAATFFEISGPEVFSKWYGQSEELIRKLFEAAGKEEKAIIFFDEIDSVAAQRGDESHEASKRVVAQLLTLMDGFKPETNVVVIAATNRPQDLDIALRRPGRFDWEIEFPYPDESDREDILTKSARRLRTKDPLPHDIIASMSAGWSAAELAQIWSEAALLAVDDGRCQIYEEDYIGGFERVARHRNRTREARPNGKTR